MYRATKTTLIEYIPTLTDIFTYEDLIAVLNRIHYLINVKYPDLENEGLTEVIDDIHTIINFQIG